MLYVIFICHFIIGTCLVGALCFLIQRINSSKALMFVKYIMNKNEFVLNFILVNWIWSNLI